MPDARWLRIEELYHAALERRSDAERREFLAAECRGDAALLREVESLLAHEAASDEFLERPALIDEARRLSSESGRFAGRDLGDYQVLSLAGSGGMGEVYRARDRTLGREAAVKILPRGGAGDVARFEAEARLASGLNHPNIVTIYGVGRAGGSSFIAMELVHGRTLREILDEGAPPLDRALDLAVQLADALAAAHASGIVHRDLKPENLMVTPEGLLKVLDFGIAKRHGAAEPETGSAAIEAAAVRTEVGTILGTVGYMSPEQAAGRPVEPASDQFAFGAIVYELISGRRAFARASREETLAAILDEEPVPIPSLAPPPAASLRALLGRCLAKRPEERFASSRELAASLRRARDEMRAPAQTPRRTSRRIAAVAVVAAALAGVALWLRPPGSGLRTVAVLPFSHGAGGGHAETVSAGLTRSLVRRLSSVSSLVVRPFSAAANFAGSNVSPRDAGRRLGADAVLTGTVAEESGHIRIAAELVDARTGARVWNHAYDAVAGGALSIEDQIARAVVQDAIRPRLSADDRRELGRRSTEDAEAWDLYLRAIRGIEQETEDGYLEARELLGKALARDPHFALAYVALATTYSVMAVDGYEPPGPAAEQVARNVRLALDADPDLPDAHSEAASALFYFQRDWEGSDREWRRAIASRGGGIVPDFLMSWALERWALGKSGEALELLRRARALDPLSPAIAVTEADYLLHAGRLDEAASAYERLCGGSGVDQRVASNACVGLAEVRRTQGRWDDAIAARTKSEPQDAPSASEAGLLRGEKGWRRLEERDAREQLDALAERAGNGGYVSPLDLARAHARLNDRERTFAHLEAALAERSPGLVFLNVDRAWNAVRDDPRFMDAVRLVGLPSVR